jgi:hypothetical protein
LPDPAGRTPRDLVVSIAPRPLAAFRTSFLILGFDALRLASRFNRAGCVRSAKLSPLNSPLLRTSSPLSKCPFASAQAIPSVVGGQVCYIGSPGSFDCLEVTDDRGRGARDVLDAVVHGRSGLNCPIRYPVHWVLPNPRADMATQEHFAARIRHPRLKPRPAPEERHVRALGPRVRGATHPRRPPDAPPGHRPAGGVPPGGLCPCRRVLVPVQANGAVLPAWLSVPGDRWNDSVKELFGGVWY